jgi:hypothetical protein
MAWEQLEAEAPSVDQLRADVAEYGQVEQAAVVPDKRCAFVSYTTVAAAVKAVQMLPTKPAFRAYRIAFGKDNCARPGRMMGAGGGGGGPAGMGARPQMMPTAAAGGDPSVALRTLTELQQQLEMQRQIITAQQQRLQAAAAAGQPAVALGVPGLGLVAPTDGAFPGLGP